MPFGQCPALEVDGKMLAQSNTIARYLARQHGLAGKNDWEQAQADMYIDCINDLITGSAYDRLNQLLNRTLTVSYIDSLATGHNREGHGQKVGTVWQL